VIVTVTVNPAIDKTAELDTLNPGELNRLRNVVTDVGGKGVNVSKTIAALGGASTATGFVGGAPGDEIVKTLESSAIAVDFLRVAGVTRTNLKVIDRGARLTELNEPGISVTADEVDALTERISALAANPGAIFVLSGSLARGMDTGYYAKLIHAIHKNGALAYLDADGESFRAALEEKPDLVKPNLHELAEYFGIGGRVDLREAEELCLRLKEKGVGKIVLSLGAGGAMFVEEDTLYAPALNVDVRSTVGAGDSMMGALAYASETGLRREEAASLAMAVSAGAVTTIGTKPPERRLVDELLKKVSLKHTNKSQNESW
jgi:1-phosphofructokinase